jgi:hypothetical protein
VAEAKVIAEFPKCPWCGCEETVTQRAWRETHGGQDKDIFVSFAKEAIPLTSTSPQVTLSLPVVPGLYIDRDYCAECGRERVTRAQVMNIPMAMVQQMMGQQFQMPGNNKK